MLHKQNQDLLDRGKSQKSTRRSRKGNEEELNEFDDNFSSRVPVATYFPDKVEMKKSHTPKISVPNIDINKIQMDPQDNHIKILSAKKSSKPAEKKISYETNEFLDVLRNVGLSPDELDKLAKNKMYTRIIEAIEMMNKIILDKNLQLRVLLEENESLNVKNTQLNNDNIFFGKQIDQLKKDITLLNNKLKNNCDTTINDDNSLIGNTSNITINNVNINSINSINKVFQKRFK